MNRRAVGVTGVAIALVTLLGACGSSDDAATTSTTSSAEAAATNTDIATTIEALRPAMQQIGLTVIVVGGPQRGECDGGRERMEYVMVANAAPGTSSDTLVAQLREALAGQRITPDPASGSTITATRNGQTWEANLSEPGVEPIRVDITGATPCAKP